MGRVCMYVALPSSWIDSSAPLVGRPDRVTQEAVHVVQVGREWGRREYWVTLYLCYLFCLVWSQCFSRHLIQTCMVTNCQPLGTPCACEWVTKENHLCSRTNFLGCLTWATDWEKNSCAVGLIWMTEKNYLSSRTNFPGCLEHEWSDVIDQLRKTTVQ